MNNKIKKSYNRQLKTLTKVKNTFLTLQGIITIKFSAKDIALWEGFDCRLSDIIEDLETVINKVEKEFKGNKYEQ